MANCYQSEYQRERKPDCMMNRNMDMRKNTDCAMNWKLEQNNNCRCKDQLAGLPLAMAYVPWQQWGALYEPDKALQEGTIFPDLNLPFCKGGCKYGR